MYHYTTQIFYCNVLYSGFPAHVWIHVYERFEGRYTFLLFLLLFSTIVVIIFALYYNYAENEGYRHERTQ